MNIGNSYLSWHANGEANSYHLLLSDGRWLAHILMNGELFVGQQTDMMERIVIALGGQAKHDSAAETALRQVSAVIQRYQAPAGISKYDAISEIIGIVQSVPLLDDATTEAQTREPHASLEDLRTRLLAPRDIVRDPDGWLSHPDMPVCDESVRYDDLLAVFGIETAFVSLESQDERLAERYFEESASIEDWNPEPPAGDGWVLLEIYDTENGPYAIFGRAMPSEVWPRLTSGTPFDFHAHLAHLTHHGDRAGTTPAEPLPTVTGANRGEQALVVANLIDMGHGESCSTGAKRWSSGVRSLETPLNSVTASSVPSALASAFFEQANGGFYDGDGRPASAISMEPNSSPIRAQ